MSLYCCGQHFLCQFTVVRERDTDREVSRETTEINTHRQSQTTSTNTKPQDPKMFEGGVPDQFHQFIASRTSLPLSFSFPSLHGSSNPPSFPSFDPYSTSQQVPLQPHFLHAMHQAPPTSKNEEKQENNMVGINLEIERERSIPESADPWSNDETLALLRIRSSMDNWFPEFAWEYVSRKLAELGFKRSAEKCKEKFEEESRYFNNINYSKTYSVFSEFEELYHGDQNSHHQVAAAKNEKMDKPTEEEDKTGQNLEDDPRIDQTVRTLAEGNKGKDVEKSKSRKRKRQKKFEMLKGFCEDVVKTLMAQQEEMHNKILEDMVKRDEEKVAREEAWQKQEMDRMNKEIELRAHEQSVAGDRQVTIIKFLKNVASNGSSVELIGKESSHSFIDKAPKRSNPPSSSSLLSPQNPNASSCQPPSSQSNHEAPSLGRQNSISLQSRSNQLMPTSVAENQAPQNPSSTSASTLDNPKVPSSSPPALAPQNPNSLNTQTSIPSAPSSSLPRHRLHTKCTPNDKEDLGKRWPRDEVLALISLRCSLYNNNDEKEGAAKAPLWERISQGMSELGYKRSAKRCKEKWENINKYFRKTKDVNKKRSTDSRTCPYFHQLSALYNQGRLIAPSEGPENHPESPENHSDRPETRPTSSQDGSNTSTLHGSEGEKNMVQAPAGFDFEF